MKYTHKYLAAMAVFAMMFAGFGVFLADDTDAAAVADKDIIITVAGVIEFGEGESAADFAPGVATVAAALDEGAVDVLSAVKYDQYVEYIKPALKNVNGDMFAIYALADFDLTDIAFKNILDETTSYVKASGAGLTTMIVFDMKLEADLTIDAANAAEAKTYAKAVAQAINLVPAGYYSQAQYDAAKAEVPAGYYSQAQYDAALAEVPEGYVKADAGEPAAAEPAKSPLLGLDMEVFMYISIVLAALLIALTVLFIFKVKPFKGLKIKKVKKI